MPIRIVEKGKVIISTSCVSEIIEYFDRRNSWEEGETPQEKLGVDSIYVTKAGEED